MTKNFCHPHSLDAQCPHGKPGEAQSAGKDLRQRRRSLAARRAAFARGRLKRRKFLRAARARLEELRQAAAMFSFRADPLPGSREPWDPELLFVECGRCGAPVLWGEGRTQRILDAAGIDPLELDASCALITDSCPACGGRKAYTLQICRIGSGPASRRPRWYGTA